MLLQYDAQVTLRVLYLLRSIAENKNNDSETEGLKIMPLSGEAIRMMNYVDDVSTTLRRILSLVPTLTPEERQRVAEYLVHANTGVDAVLKALRGN